ncbi:MAG: SufE family protein, partial [Bacteroidota bacterium]
MASRPIAEIEQEIVEEFEFLEDWMDKYQHLIDLGKELPTLEEGHKTEDNIVRGCQSKVWLAASDQAGSVHFEA